MHRWPTIAFLAAFVAFAPRPLVGGVERDASDVSADSRVSAGDRPVSFAGYFEKNLGQTSAEVSFLTRARGMTAFLTPEEVVIAAATRARSGEPSRDVFRMAFAGARPLTTPDAERPLPGRSNYLKGNDRRRWVTGVPHFESVVYRDLWPGVDMRWRSASDGRLAYDFVVAPGADPGAIACLLRGADRVEVDARGDLVATTER